MQLIGDAFVAAPKDDDQLADRHGAMAMPGSGDRPREGRNAPPIQGSGACRHFIRPRPQCTAAGAEAAAGEFAEEAKQSMDGMGEVRGMELQQP